MRPQFLWFVVTGALAGMLLVEPAHTASRRESGPHDWRPGDVFVGLGDGRGFTAAWSDTDPDLPGIQPPDAPYAHLFDLLGTYRVVRVSQPDGSQDEDVVVPVRGITTGCAIDALTGDLLATSFDAATLDRLSGRHDEGHQLIRSVDVAAAVSGPLGAYSVESIVLDRARNSYVGLPDGESDINPGREVLQYDRRATLLKFSPTGQKLAEYRLPVRLYPKHFKPSKSDAMPRGVDWIALSADESTLFYTSEDRFVRTFVFDTDPRRPGEQPGPGPANPVTIDGTRYEATPGVWAYVTKADPADMEVFGLRLLPPGDGSGGMLVASPYGLHRLDGSGVVTNFMPEPIGAHGFFAISLTPDAQYAWTATNGDPGAILKYHVASGQLMTFRGADRITLPGPANGLCVKQEYTPQSVDCRSTPGNPLCQRFETCSAVSPGDDDGDGLADGFDPDCVANASEVCGNGVDDDRNGLVDEMCDRTSAEYEEVRVPMGAGPPGERRSYSVRGLPDGLRLDPVTGEIAGRLSSRSAGDWPVMLVMTRTTVTGAQATVTSRFVWHVADVNVPPEIHVVDVTIAEGQDLVLAPLALPLPTDEDGDPLRHSIWSEWWDPSLRYDPATGTISGVVSPVAGDEVHTFFYTVSDLDPRDGTTILHTVQKKFTLTVRDLGR